MSKPSSGAGAQSSTAAATTTAARNPGSTGGSGASTPTSSTAAGSKGPQAPPAAAKSGPGAPPPAAGAGGPQPPNPWSARAKAAREAAAATTTGPSASAAAPSLASTAAGKAPSQAAGSTPPASATGGAPSAASQSQSTASSAATPLKDLASLLGKPLKITTPSGVVAYGLLWCYDNASGTIVLETGTTLPSSSSSVSELASTPYSTALSSNQRRTEINVPRSGFRILKAREVRAVDVLSQSTADSLGLPKGISTIDSSVASPAGAEARERAAVRDFQVKASKLGKGVSQLGQSIFDALSKTMNCRWHEQHIIVMDEIVIHGPQYDGSSTTVPGFTADQLRALSEGSNSSAIPSNMTASEAKAKANSWTRVVKVLEGERKRIVAKQSAAPT